MHVETLLQRLGYADSPAFLRAGSGTLETTVDYGHIFRQATGKPCHLKGVYTLRPELSDARAEAVVPVVYVCEAKTEDDADEIHRLVWNQDVVPFVLVHTPRGVRLYSGFAYARQGGANRSAKSGVLQTLTAFNQIADLVDDFKAEAIDRGRLWQQWGRHLSLDQRLDWKLLANLQQLDEWLQTNGGLEREVSHALIGKYVFLRYLRDRGILSDRKLESWQIDHDSVFSRNASRSSLAALDTKLQNWLNGSIFPLKLSGRNAPKAEHVRRVAATFSGDELIGESEWQLHLDFAAYDFSYIPIETLSVIYEQFLHSDSASNLTSRGREAGAYYTPIPLVNLMLSELDERVPLKRGRSVLDPACGSGAFLVQCYRRLIEAEFPATGRKRPTPFELRDLLVQHIYGVDRDPDACGVTELSLVLTLLDYVDPPDLEESPDIQRPKQFKLPKLRDRNVICANFFPPKNEKLSAIRRRKFDWVVGNPPWKPLDPKKLIPEDEPVWNWIKDNGSTAETPVGGNRMSQAFAWQVRSYLKTDGEAAFLLPGMILFEDRSRKFRSAFFRKHDVHTVVNLANLTELLFVGRSRKKTARVPAAAFFFALNDPDAEPAGFVTTYSPLVANQESTRERSDGVRQQLWNLTVNGSDIRDIPLFDISDGDGLAWKLATWGSQRDSKLLRRLERRYDSLKKLEGDSVVTVSEGLQLRTETDANEPLDEVSEVVGKHILDVKALEKLRHVFAFPESAINTVPQERRFARKGRAKLPLSVCRGPHVIVSAARIFAVYTDDYLVVPPRQIGIISPDDDKDLLKALSLFLSSDFAFYHQFLTSTQFGIKRDVATLRSLRDMPIPIADLPRSELRKWSSLQVKLAKTRPRKLREETPPKKERTLFDNGDEVAEDGQAELLLELNERVNDALGLDDRERALVHDLCHVRFELNDGHLGAPAVDPPTVPIMRAYARRLKAELDGFIGDTSSRRHRVSVVYDGLSGMIELNFMPGSSARKISVDRADKSTARQLERTRRNLRKEHSQWLYFERNLRVYDGRKTYLFKPMQRFHWTESQALNDAADIVAETLSSQEGDA